jgi:predicted protein tyrosine phosphatase
VEYIKILFVCSRNKQRSLTAEKVFNKYNGIEVKSAGTETGARVRISQGLIGWADIIFVMEKKHIRRLREKFGEALVNKQVICLNIPDEYEFMDEELIGALKSVTFEYLGIT